MSNSDFNIGVIGAGAMGAGIAQVAASHGHEVYLYDTKPEALVRSRDKLQAILNRLVEKKRLTDVESKAIFGRIYFIDQLASFKDSHMIIEAIVEDLTIKKSVFGQLEDIVSDSCILASNTSSLSITAIAGGCKFSDRVIGVHFFNPAPLMKLVEIIPAIQTDPQITSFVTELIREWKKIAVIAKDTPGFIVNRVARPFYGEALRILDEGLANVATIDWAMKELGGFRMGPFELMDYIGNDVNYKVTETVFKAFYNDPRYKPSFTQKALSDAGYLGRKSGRGYYDYAEDATKSAPDRNKVLGQLIVDRIVIMLINEAADASYLKIASVEDIDLAMTKGVNYPKGLLAWADEKGIEQCVLQMDELYNFYHEDRYRCSPILRNLAKKSELFFN
ncbi:UNVERIFIED_CONTAM: hypothetical protein GTU68_062855 [Idotea baltica]|nr:hypothetical protein [Idotea baltica]